MCFYDKLVTMLCSIYADEIALNQSKVNLALCIQAESYLPPWVPDVSVMQGCVDGGCMGCFSYTDHISGIHPL
jgi:hypothetical protein